eukprot:360224-Chlamydomonas_euryale.AAC.2
MKLSAKLAQGQPRRHRDIQMARLWETSGRGSAQSDAGQRTPVTILPELPQLCATQAEVHPHVWTT